MLINNTVMRYMKKITAFAIIGLFFSFFMPQKAFSQNSQLTFEDVMKWEDISGQAISDDGRWIAYSVWPDRGDGEVRVRQVDDRKTYTITLGDDPEITSNGNWVAAELKPKLAKQIKAEQNQPVDGMALLNTANGNMVNKDSVQSFTFSNDGNWVILRHYQSKEVEEKKSKNRFLGTTLTLRNLSSGEEHTIPFVNEAGFDSTSNYLAYSVVDTGGNSNGLYYRNLESSPSQQQQITSEEDGLFANLSWDNANQQLAFTQAAMDTTFETSDANLQVWNASQDEVNTLIEASETNKGWALRTNNDLEWTDDGSRLFFGLMARDMVEVDQKDEEEQDSLDIYDREQILSKKGVDVWHYNDPRIKPHQKETWNQRKERTYQSVYHMNDDRWVQLADRRMPNIEMTQNPNYALGSSRVPYLQLMTWDYFYSDYYVLNLNNGERRRIAKKLPFGAEMSPNGQFVVFYQDKDWHLYDVGEDIYRNLTEDIDVPFYNEDHDYPYPTPGYDVAGWTSGDNSVLIYDKYDLWKFDTSQPSAVNITQDGRDREISYRIQEFDDEQEAFRSDEQLLVRGYYDHKKYYGFYTVELDQQGAERQLETEHKYNFVDKPENSDRIFYSREKYDVYPNIWVADGITFDDTQRITALHLNLHEKYNWGTAELIEWQGIDDGQTIRGAVIKPDNYNPEKKYPVLIYYYRFFSQRAYEFNNITNDDRPTLPQWVSDQYVVFLPDIRFEVGTPGFASTKSLVPGVNKLIEMGIADPDKLGLHGHSWSGYQTAFMVTQTDIFDAAIAGAPVSNMTSAYSGIRWGSGLARQFQYEQTQSRIGGSLWEYPERYIENSPVFYADRINTPMLMMFGDEDTAVPWYQGIEMYLAMRRLNKDAIFLQYRGEPHHLQEYGNRLDYAIKMKEYFDHYLRGAPAPKWITDGVPYRGE
jgi:dipeptidyl aminopeptidase/acylaminoacyl peptidase